MTSRVFANSNSNSNNGIAVQPPPPPPPRKQGSPGIAPNSNKGIAVPHPPPPSPPPRNQASPGIAPKITTMEDYIAEKTASKGGVPVQNKRRLRQLEAAAGEEAVSSSDDDEVDEDDMPGAVRVAGINSTTNGSSEMFFDSSGFKTENEESQHTATFVSEHVIDKEEEKIIASQPTAILVSEHFIDEEEQKNIVKEAQLKVEENLKAAAVQAQVQDIDEENKRKALRKKRIICAVVLVVLIAVGTGIGAYFGTREPDADPTPAPTPRPPTSAPTPDPELDLSNNICEGAFSIASVTGLLGANLNSTTDNVDTCEIIFENGVGAWYRMQGDEQRMVASTCQETSFKPFDSQISIFQGVCGRLQCVAGNDQMGCGNGDQSQVAWFAEADTAYFIFVHGRRQATGRFALTVVPLVENDECESALSVELFSVPFFGSTRGASVDSVVQCGDARHTAPGVWYTFEGPGGTRIGAGVLIRDEMGLRITTAFRGQISVFEGSDCGNLECVTGSSDGRVELEPIEDKTYFVLVNGQGVLEGDFILTIGGPLDKRVINPSLCVDATGLLPGGSPVNGSTFFQPQFDFFASCGDTIFLNAPGLWFKAVGTGGAFQASTCGTTSDFDTQISLFVGNCSSLECLDGNDQGGECGDGSTLSWFTIKGEDYFIFVHGHSGRTGTFELSLEEITIEVSDTCAESIRLPSNGSTRLGSTDGANLGDLPSCEGPGTGPGVWYEFIGTGVEITASTCQADSGASRITIYTGECDALKCVDKVTTPCGPQSSVTWNTELGVKYYVFVQDASKASEEVRFLQSEIVLPASRVPKGSFVLRVEGTPINNLCGDAIGPILADGSTTFASTRSATSADFLFCTDETQLGRGIWYTIIGDGRLLTASTCSEYTRFKSQITVFEGDESCNDLRCIGEFDYIGEFYEFNFGGESLNCGRASVIQFPTVAGREYYILVSGGGFEEFGNFGLTIGADNDICQGAIELLADNSITLGSTIGASIDDVVDCGGFIVSPGVWYKVRGGQGSRMTASTCNSNTEYETEIFIYRGSCGRLECVEDVEYTPCGFQSTVSWTASAFDNELNELYYVLVHGYGAGAFGLSITIENQGCPGARRVLEESRFANEFGSTTNAPNAEAIACGVQQESPGNWFVLEGTGSTVTASACETPFATMISVFRGVCNNLECVTSEANSELCETLIAFDTTFGELLYILVQGADLQQSGSFGLYLERAEPTTCENAIGPQVISREGGILIDGSLPFISNSEEEGTVCGQATDFGGGYYYSVAGTGTTIDATTCFETTDFDTQLTVYAGPCDDLRCITGNDYVEGSQGRKRLNRELRNLEDLGCSSLTSSFSFASSVSWESEVGVDYFVYIHGFPSSFGNFTLSIEAIYDD